MNHAPDKPRDVRGLPAALAAEQYRPNWLDFYQRMRWAGHDPETRLAEQFPDLLKWHNLGKPRSVR